MYKKNLIRYIALILLASIAFMFNTTDAKEKIKDYIFWLGNYENRDSLPEVPMDFGVYFDEEDGNSYIFDGNGWQVFAAKGADGQDADLVVIDDLTNKLVLAEQTIQNLTNRLNEAENNINELSSSFSSQTVSSELSTLNTPH